MLTYENLN